MLFLFAFVIRHALCHQKLYVNLLVSRHSQSGGWGARRLMRRPAPTMLFVFAFVIRHTLCRQKLYVNLLVSRHGQLTCGCCVRGTTLYNPLGITIGFWWLFTFLFFTIRVQFRSRQVPSLFFKKFAFHVQIRRQSFTPPKHQTDYPVSISLFTETHVSMHIVHNLLVVLVVVTCSAVCASQ